MQLFLRLSTQWRHGFNGPTGLDHTVTVQFIDRSGYSGPDWWRVMDEIQLMERAALMAMRGDTDGN